MPRAGAPFKFEATPPFGLETSFAIVTPVPLDERDFQAVEGGFAKPKHAVTEVLATRGIRLSPVEGSGGRLVWDSVTVLVRP